ncbi:hypothetical protein L209DRAFT_48705 [Thermothelomyces heterothallicus CBS 203.75]
MIAYNRPRQVGNTLRHRMPLPFFFLVLSSLAVFSNRASTMGGRLGSSRLVAGLAYQQRLPSGQKASSPARRNDYNTAFVTMISEG